jgi:hypothetical protein
MSEVPLTDLLLTRADLANSGGFGQGSQAARHCLGALSHLYLPVLPITPSCTHSCIPVRSYLYLPVCLSVHVYLPVPTYAFPYCPAPTYASLYGFGQGSQVARHRLGALPLVPSCAGVPRSYGILPP